MIKPKKSRNGSGFKDINFNFNFRDIHKRKDVCITTILNVFEHFARHFVVMVVKGSELPVDQDITLEFCG